MEKNSIERSNDGRDGVHLGNIVHRAGVHGTEIAEQSRNNTARQFTDISSARRLLRAVILPHKSAGPEAVSLYEHIAVRDTG